MNPFYLIALAILIFPLSLAAAPPDSATVILTEAGVKNLRIETETVQETNFEETVFALGHIEAIPERSAVVSSRISGRVAELSATPGISVRKDQTVVRVESRQPGDPPPVIPLQAPLDGMVMQTSVKLGEPVEPDKALMEIIDLSEVYAIARVPENQLGKIKPNATAHIRISAIPGKVFDAKLVRFGSTANEESGTMDVVFRLANPDLVIRPGMRAEYSIVTGVRENIISIPRAALQGSVAERFVYVKHFDLPNAFVKAAVQVGEMNDRYVEITGGLFPADDVVTRGAYSLSFAGGGSGVSLKEALDAAHGHEHAEDGSELTPEKKKESEQKHRAANGASADAPGAAGSDIWKYVSGVLFLLLLASLCRKPRQPQEDAAVVTSEPERH